MARKQAKKEPEGPVLAEQKAEMPFYSMGIGQMLAPKVDPRFEEETALREEATRAINRYVVHCATQSNNAHGVVVGAQALEKLRGW